NLYDIGKTGATRPRDGFFARNLTVGGTGAFSGTITGTSFSGTGTLRIMNASTPTAGGVLGGGYKFGTTSTFGIFWGSGVPTIAADQGSLYLRTDGSSTSTRL